MGFITRLPVNMVIITLVFCGFNGFHHPTPCQHDGKTKLVDFEFQWVSSPDSLSTLALWLYSRRWVSMGFITRLPVNSLS